MPEIQYPELNQDVEYQSLKHPPSKQYINALRRDICNNGCRSPLLVCDGTIIDGYKRYEICINENIPFTIERRDGMSRIEIIKQICMDQLRRDDLPPEMYKYLVGRRFRADREINISELEAKKDDPRSRFYLPRYTRQDSKLRIASAIGEELNLAAGTVLKYDVFAQNIDIIKKSSPSMADSILSGILRIAHETLSELSLHPREEVCYLESVIREKKMTHLVYSDINSELRWRTVGRTKKKSVKKKAEAKPAIRDMPKYDPDAEISSLTLTIPSWISSIDRVREKTDFSLTTKNANSALHTQLDFLETCIHSIKLSIKEAEHNENEKGSNDKN